MCLYVRAVSVFCVSIKTAQKCLDLSLDYSLSFLDVEKAVPPPVDVRMTDLDLDYRKRSHSIRQSAANLPEASKTATIPLCSMQKRDEHTFWTSSR
ncbi:hypothetical protein AVEN_214953-1 [Araneus ventricosus]|uniref:Uncharacterized protein n=1 Tax=Araneus ventricosus TaxID=182803 RepID=A0A4Y2DAZ1_ARAVE|nr:hypothetical protein AVEN_214953-1 [Araneus ventricosus]